MKMWFLISSYTTSVLLDGRVKRIHEVFQNCCEEVRHRTGRREAVNLREVGKVLPSSRWFAEFSLLPKLIEGYRRVNIFVHQKPTDLE